MMNKARLKRMLNYVLFPITWPTLLIIALAFMPHYLINTCCKEKNILWWPVICIHFIFWLIPLSFLMALNIIGRDVKVTSDNDNSISITITTEDEN